MWPNVSSYVVADFVPYVVASDIAFDVATVVVSYVVPEAITSVDVASEVFSVVIPGIISVFSVVSCEVASYEVFVVSSDVSVAVVADVSVVI